MATKKKLFMAIFSLSMLILLGVIAIATVWAAETQKVNSQVSVTYTATNVSAQINGDYLLNGDSNFTSMGAAIEFQPTDETVTKSVGVNGVTLSESKNFLILKYTFKNNSESVRILVKPIATISNSTNITVTYAFSDTEITNYNLIATATASNFYVEKGSSAYAYVKVKITDLSTSSSFSGSFNFDLSKTE